MFRKIARRSLSSSPSTSPSGSASPSPITRRRSPAAGTTCDMPRFLPNEHGQRPALGPEMRVGDVADVLAVDLERRRGVALDPELVRVVHVKHLGPVNMASATGRNRVCE